jgi:hypothetical protein
VLTRSTESTPPPQTRTGKGRFAPGGSSGNKKALKHGVYVYQAMLNGKGLDDTVKNMLYIASLNNYLMGLKSLVRKAVQARRLRTTVRRGAAQPCWNSQVRRSTGSGMTGREVRPICCKTEEKEQRRQ